MKSPKILSSPSPKSQCPGLGLTLKSHGPPHPITFKHGGLLWYKSANSKSGSEWTFWLIQPKNNSSWAWHCWTPGLVFGLFTKKGNQWILSKIWIVTVWLSLLLSCCASQVPEESKHRQAGKQVSKKAGRQASTQFEPCPVGACCTNNAVQIFRIV